MPAAPAGKLLAISDLHVVYAENREFVRELHPDSDDDWLLIAGDVGELVEDIEWVLRLLKQRFRTVVWAPGNHELWTHPEDSVQLRGAQRYQYLVELCRGLGVVTPEDPYPVWDGAGGPITVAPLFVLYDYTFRMPGMTTKEMSLANAYDAGVVCTDEFLLHPDPYPTRDAWCAARLGLTRRRLEARQHPDLPTVLVTHFPLVREVTDEWLATRPRDAEHLGAASLRPTSLMLVPLRARQCRGAAACHRS